MNLNDSKYVKERVQFYNPNDSLHRDTTLTAILITLALIAVIGWVLAGGEI